MLVSEVSPVDEELFDRSLPGQSEDSLHPTENSSKSAHNAALVIRLFFIVMIPFAQYFSDK